MRVMSSLPTSSSSGTSKSCNKEKAQGPQHNLRRLKCKGADRAFQGVKFHWMTQQELLWVPTA